MEEKQEIDKPVILIVDDQPVIIRTLSQLLNHDYHILAVKEGVKALEIARSEKQPDLILLDISMPDINGYEVCEKLKADELTAKIPIIFVTAKDEADEEERGFLAGASDYIVKPFHPAVVQARIKVNIERKLALEKLKYKIIELKKALNEIKKLQGIIPICSNCKKIRDDEGYWQQVEDYFHEHNDTEFTHGICPDCMKKLYSDLLKDDFLE